MRDFGEVVSVFKRVKRVKRVSINCRQSADPWVATDTRSICTMEIVLDVGSTLIMCLKDHWYRIAYHLSRFAQSNFIPSTLRRARLPLRTKWLSPSLQDKHDAARIQVMTFAIIIEPFFPSELRLRWFSIASSDWMSTHKMLTSWLNCLLWIRFV